MRDAALIRGDAVHLPLADNSVDAVITSPPYAFTPRYCGLLSRPFLVLPWPFLCAIEVPQI